MALATKRLWRRNMYECHSISEQLHAKPLQATWDRERKNGLFNSRRYKKHGNFVPCIDGYATAIPGDRNNTFRCNNVSSAERSPVHLC